jgi:hypothetical protein
MAGGSVLSLDKSVLGSPSLANSAYFLEIFGKITEQENQIYVQDKLLGYIELKATLFQTRIIAVSFAVVLPLIILSIGIAVWLRRRHK